MLDKLKRGMRSGEPTIELLDDPSDQYASGGRASRYRSVRINLAIRSGVPIETGRKDQYGLERYSTARIPDFAPNLWHELVGHAVVGLDYPKTQENVYPFVKVKAILEYESKRMVDPGTKTPDPTIVEENKARAILQLKLRRPQYLDEFHPKWHEWYVRPPSNWDRLQDRASKAKGNYNYE